MERISRWFYRFYNLKSTKYSSAHRKTILFCGVSQWASIILISRPSCKFPHARWAQAVRNRKTQSRLDPFNVNLRKMACDWKWRAQTVYIPRVYRGVSVEHLPMSFWKIHTFGPCLSVHLDVPYTTCQWPRFFEPEHWFYSLLPRGNRPILVHPLGITCVLWFVVSRE